MLWMREESLPATVHVSVLMVTAPLLLSDAGGGGRGRTVRLSGAEDLGDPVATLFHPDEAQSEPGDTVADQVVGLLARRLDQEDVARSRQPLGVESVVADERDPGLGEDLAQGVRTVRMVVAVGHLDRQGRGDRGEVAGRAGPQQ